MEQARTPTTSTTSATKSGSDTYYVDDVGDKVVEATGAVGTDLVYASVSYGLSGADLENLILTGTGNLNGTGNGLANVITGNAGANVLNGLVGADTMSPAPATSMGPATASPT
ncbi:hypothetical protein ASG40_20120 [Methylobacterium sp. Leaf399]|nr:hypothetical protein ASG40_20120 [Methylobacterium sp. Leaf399]